MRPMRVLVVGASGFVGGHVAGAFAARGDEVVGLVRSKARVYKLTPRMSLRNMKFGHGFHFTVPRPGETLYLDVMATPPRVGSFADARARALSAFAAIAVLPYGVRVSSTG